MKKLLFALLLILTFVPLTAFSASSETLDFGIVPEDKNLLPFSVFPDESAELFSSKDVLEKRLLEAFDDLAPSVDIEDLGFTVGNAFSDLYRSIIYKHPEYYYVSKGFYYYSTHNKYTKILITYTETDKQVINKHLEEIELEAEKMLFHIRDDMTDFEKVLTVHDRMALEYSYDLADEPSNESRNISIILTKKGVCEAYAAAFTYFMNRLGINTYYVTSNEMMHVWNLVEIDGKCYHIDCTWDDPVPDTAGFVSHEYALASSKFFSSGSSVNHYGFNTGAITANSTKYDKAPFRASESVLVFDNGEYFFIDGNEIKTTGGKTVFENLDGADSAWDIEGGYYLDGFVLTSLCEYNGELIFNTDEKIYALDIPTGNCRVLFDTPHTCGMYIIGNTLFVKRYSFDIGYFDTAESYPLGLVRVTGPYIFGGELIIKILNSSSDSADVFAVSDTACSMNSTDKGVTVIKIPFANQKSVFIWNKLLCPLTRKFVLKY